MRAIGSPDRATRLAQVRTFARCQVWSGYRSDAQVRADVYEAALAEEGDAGRAAALTDELVADARDELAAACVGWTSPDSFGRLQQAIAQLRANGVVVLEAIDDHWTASATLERLASAGLVPAGIAYFTLPDVWHAVEHGMLEINVWHADTANTAPGDALLDLVLQTLRDNDIAAVFDEGRIEATLAWERTPDDDAG